MTQKIIAAAIRVDGVLCSLPKPYRHHDIIYHLAKSGMPTPIIGVQGFLTDEGLFLNRKDSLIVAKDAGQILTKTGNPSELYSEDVW